MLDIPDSGAVFIIGDSFLKNNQENYFFIKNDPVVEIYANYYGQNGVICESGKLFVWGHNQYGQLGVGPKDIVTKPTVVRQFRDSGVKVKDVAFGYQFVVVLSDDSKVFFAGRSIFPPTSKIYSLKGRFDYHSDTTEYSDTFIELTEFDYFTELEVQDFDKIYAGGNHFVVQTKCGRLIGWGQNGGGQMGRVDNYLLTKDPLQLPIENVRHVVCGNEYTLVVTDRNEIFVTGKFNHTQSMNFTQLNTSTLDSNVSTVHVSIIEEICVITENHNIFISKSREKLEEFAFYKLKLLEDCDKIVRLESGSNFLAFVTDTQRFFTNFKDTDDLGEYPEFHELQRFSNFQISAFKCGLNYVLLKGVPKVDAFGLNESRVHKPLLSFTEDYGDGFSEASTESPLENPNQRRTRKQSPPKHFEAINAIHKEGRIKFIENGVERSGDQDVERYLGQEIPKKRNAKEEVRRMIMEERTPMRRRSPKVRIKTPLPSKPAFVDSSGSSTAESDHSVDEDLNRRVTKPETRVSKFFRRLKERAIAFEESCKDPSNVIPDANEDDLSHRQRANQLAMTKSMPKSFICSIQ